MKFSLARKIITRIKVYVYVFTCFHFNGKSFTIMGVNSILHVVVGIEGLIYLPKLGKQNKVSSLLVVSINFGF